eukprot:scaffold31183_cov31-Tisochrysis_lutea.AAC.3
MAPTICTIPTNRRPTIPRITMPVPNSSCTRHITRLAMQQLSHRLGGGESSSQSCARALSAQRRVTLDTTSTTPTRLNTTWFGQTSIKGGHTRLYSRQIHQ